MMIVTIIVISITYNHETTMWLCKLSRLEHGFTSSIKGGISYFMWLISINNEGRSIEGT